MNTIINKAAADLSRSDTKPPTRHDASANIAVVTENLGGYTSNIITVATSSRSENRRLVFALSVFKIFTACLLLSLSGCGQAPSINYTFNTEKTPFDLYEDHLNCEIESVKVVPADIQVAFTPKSTTPVQTRCRTSSYGYGLSRTNCTTSGGLTVGGDPYTYDANKNLRDEYFNNCLHKIGYGTVVVPMCGSNQIPRNFDQIVQSNMRQPQLGACFVKVTERSGNLLLPEELIK